MKERRAHLILLGGLIVALLAVAAIAIPGSPIHKKPTLGLDLQGGLEVVLEAQPPRGRELTGGDLDRSVEIIRNRIDKLGVSEPEVRKQGENQIVVQLAGVFDIDRATSIIGKTAQLQLYDLQKNLIPGVSLDAQGFPIATPTLYAILNNSAVKSRAERGTPTAYYLFNKQKERVAGPKPTRQALLDGRKIKRQLKNGKLPQGWQVLALPEKTIILRCGPEQRYCPGANEETPSRQYYYLFKSDPENKEDPVPEMTGKDLKLNGTRQDFSTQNNEPIVTIQFTDSGGKKFHRVTRELAQRGQSVRNRVPGIDDQTAFQQFAIVLDNVIQSSPTIDFNENPDGIPPGGGAQITGIGSLKEAKDLALVLQTGALPVRFNVAERTDVSATLGQDSLKEAERAAIVGLLVVALFLLIFYRFLGLVAVIGLGIYAAFMYAAILLFNVTLTLPGFAGMILTIGVAADANVVVFERIKEEARAGRSVRAAISTGYAKGFHTILDANAVTAITALVLFLVASAGVKGFALMLLIGTAISLVTAVAATRAMLGLLAGFSWFDNPRFMGASGSQRGKWMQIDFMARTKLWFAISGVVLALSLGSIAVKGLNLGIDFKGGTQLTFDTPQAHAIDDVRNTAEGIDSQFAHAVIQGRGRSSNGDEYKSFQVRTESLSPPEQQQLRTGFQDELQATKFGAKNVSESFGRQIARSAILAILFSLFLIILYIGLRFDLKYAGPVIVALLHDVLITVGVYSLTAREVTTSTIAAVLTVLGYSIYDTIIIFDRIRENVPLMKRASFANIANVSLWETIRRSLATTFITLLPVAALFLFGGETLKDFAFALLVGIGSGAYSSIFIAAPLLTLWKEREPDWARRKGTVEVGTHGEALLLEAEQAQVAEEPVLADLEPVTPDGDGDGAAPVSAAARTKRDRRRQRRRTRPHGRR